MVEAASNVHRFGQYFVCDHTSNSNVASKCWYNSYPEPYGLFELHSHSNLDKPSNFPCTIRDEDQDNSATRRVHRTTYASSDVSRVLYLVQNCSTFSQKLREEIMGESLATRLGGLCLVHWEDVVYTPYQEHVIKDNFNDHGDSMHCHIHAIILLGNQST